MRQRISHMNTVSRLFLVVLAILVCQAAVAQTDDSGFCCPPGFFVGELGVTFKVGTSQDRAEEIFATFDVQVTAFFDFPFGPTYRICVPIGEESALATMLSALPEVQYAIQNGVVCFPELPDCECCPCDFDCPSLAPCDLECEIDADSDTFADSCDRCTDTDGDGFGDPEFDVSTCPGDNCPDSFNPDQADLDGDGIGDECDRRLTVCHRPPGKPAGTHTITIALPAFPAHLAHGDVPGACTVKRPRGGADRPGRGKLSEN